MVNFIVEKLTKNAKTPAAVQVWLPLGGVSMIATPEGPFADKEADDVLFSTIKRGLNGSGVRFAGDLGIQRILKIMIVPFTGRAQARGGNRIIGTDIDLESEGRSCCTKMAYPGIQVSRYPGYLPSYP